MVDTSSVLAFGVLCCFCRCSPSGNAFPAAREPPRWDDRAAPAVGPSADTLPRPDTVVVGREKRQLSSVQSRLLNFLKPLPIVDVTKEEEKYGNDGDKFNRFGRSFIGGVETMSSVVTSALSFPLDTAKKLSRTVTEMLNNVGGRIVGLQR